MYVASSSRRVTAKSSKRKAPKKEKEGRKKTKKSDDLIASDSVDLAGPPKCPFIVEDMMTFWPNTPLGRRLKGMSRLFPGNPTDREISTATPQMQEEMKFTKLIKEHLSSYF